MMQALLNARLKHHFLTNLQTGDAESEDAVLLLPSSNALRI